VAFGQAASGESAPPVPEAGVESLPTLVGGGRGSARSHASDLDVVEHDVDGVRVVGVSGELDLAGAVKLCARVDAARDAGRRRLVLDLTRLEFCDSSGLRALIGAAAEVRATAGRVVIVPPVAGAVARLFALAGVEEILPLRSSVSDGLGALGSRGGG
jgi:anti-sigma B factor antagonist